MNRTPLIAFAAGSLATAGIAVLIAAGPEHKEHNDHAMHEPDHHDAGDMPQMDEAQMMAEMMRLSTPDEHHTELGEMVGSWHAKTSFMMDPSQPPMEGEGSMTIEWVLGGRFLKSDFTMDFMGQPFQGLSYMGYDIAHQQYVSTWMDTMTTKITYMEGHKEGDAMVMMGTSTTPMGDSPMKIVTTHQGKDQVTDKFFDQLPDGTWMNTGTIVYTRK